MAMITYISIYIPHISLRHSFPRNKALLRGNNDQKILAKMMNKHNQRATIAI